MVAVAMTNEEELEMMEEGGLRSEAKEDLVVLLHPLVEGGQVIRVAAAVVAADKSARLASVDVVRGLSIAVMILVDHAGNIWPAINHSPWNGITLADFVMPFFLFVVGVALDLTFKRRTGNKKLASQKALGRSLELFVGGLIIQGGYFHGFHNTSYGVDLERIRWCGVLQVRCGVRGDVGPDCNVVGYLDRSILDFAHVHVPKGSGSAHSAPCLQSAAVSWDYTSATFLTIARNLLRDYGEDHCVLDSNFNGILASLIWYAIQQATLQRQLHAFHRRRCRNPLRRLLFLGGMSAAGDLPPECSNG